MPALHLRLLILNVLLAGLPAMDPPEWVVAVTASGAAAEGAYRPCGGAAVSLGGGMFLTLAESLPSGDPWLVAPGGQRRLATITARGQRTTAVLLRAPMVLPPAPLADPSNLPVGAVLWSAGNSFGSIELDGQVALSRGILSAYDVVADDGAPVRGRGGQVLSTYSGPILETDVAVNDGNQGGALIDSTGSVVALATLARNRERRMGAGVSVAACLRELGLSSPTPSRGIAEPLAATAARTAASIVLVQFERPNGPGNPEAIPRPGRMPSEVPTYERERTQQQWDLYYHQQQLFRTDQPVPALVTGTRELVTAASNLHGKAKRGLAITPNGQIAVTVRAQWSTADLVLLVADADLGLPIAPLAAPAVGQGESIAVVGRHGANLVSVTTGIVSTVGRRRGQEIIGLLQIDALCNYGSLGGAVVDMAGRVVGMTIMLGPEGDRPWGINSGVALAVDGTSISEALPKLRTGKDRTGIRYAGLGVRLDRSKLRTAVVGVTKGSGAESAGIKVGDVLITIDGAQADNPQAVTRALLRRSGGQSVFVVLERDGERQSIEVTIREVDG